MTVSLIISTYNWSEALGLVLDSALIQSSLPMEIIVADDGSGPATREVVERCAAAAAVPVKHVWHEDTGFRLAAIRNKAIAAARGEYIVQVDGDVVLHRHFIRDHMRLARKGCFVSASRAQITRKFYEQMLNNKNLRVCWLSKGVDSSLNALHSRLLCGMISPFYKVYIRGCNMGFWREDLLAVNGYNEQIEGWGYEETDMAARMQNMGLKYRSVKFACVCFHIRHEQASHENFDRNGAITEKARAEGTIRCAKGVGQYL